MHWVDRTAKTLLRKSKRHVIASGISISGHIHIGHCNDVFIADAVRRSIVENGGSAVAFWYADDFDPMRRVPHPLPSEYEQYLGVPYVDIPLQHVSTAVLKRMGRAGGRRQIEDLLGRLRDRMDDLVNFLGARPFFYAERLSRADLSVYAMLHTLRLDAIPGAALVLGQRPPLVAFMMRVEEKTGG